MSWVPACACSAGYRQFDRGPADQVDQVKSDAQPMPQPAPPPRAVGDQPPQTDSVAQAHPADRQEAGISVALDAPISQYHTMSPEFVADINQRAGTLANLQLDSIKNENSCVGDSIVGDSIQFGAIKNVHGALAADEAVRQKALCNSIDEGTI
jgi:hypothetical protein